MNKFDEQETIQETLDELYDVAKEMVVLYQKASPALLNRKLNISYERCEEFMDAMEKEGVVGPPDAQHFRRVLVAGN